MKLQMRDFHWNEDFEQARHLFIDIWNVGPLYRNGIPSMFENRKFGLGGTEYLDEEDEFVKF
jgi:hypothetical protein